MHHGLVCSAWSLLSYFNSVLDTYFLEIEQTLYYGYFICMSTNVAYFYKSGNSIPFVYDSIIPQ